jgi:hypothetical protein
MAQMVVQSLARYHFSVPLPSHLLYFLPWCTWRRNLVFSASFLPPLPDYNYISKKKLAFGSFYHCYQIIITYPRINKRKFYEFLHILQTKKCLSYYPSHLCKRWESSIRLCICWNTEEQRSIFCWVNVSNCLTEYQWCFKLWSCVIYRAFAVVHLNWWNSLQ